MGVELIHCTPDAERLIVKMARVSAPQNADNWETGPKLLRYLIQHRHWSPFEMASMCVKIETERDIAAQILRHRSFSFQEFSTRYAVAQEPVVPQLRRQDTKNRQNSIDDLPEDVTAELRSRVKLLFGESSKLYNDLLDQGVAKETARRILPLSTGTTMFMHSTLRSWIHYIEVRTDPGTQLEHRQIAEACRQIFSEQFPITAEALGWSQWAGL
jgi:thymidylate synthase (FAD)